MPPLSGSMRITSAPNCAIVIPPSGAATNAENSTMRKSARSLFMPVFSRKPDVAAMLTATRRNAAALAGNARRRVDVGKSKGTEKTINQEDRFPPSPRAATVVEITVRSDRRSNLPVATGFAPELYWIIVGLGVWLAISIWGFCGSGYTALVMAIISLLVAIAVGVALLVVSLVRRRREPRA